MEIDRQRRIIEMHNAGVSQQEIARTLGVSQSRISRLLQRADQQEIAQRLRIEQATTLRRSAGDIAELLVILRDQRRTQKVQTLIRKSLRYWQEYSRRVRAVYPDWTPRKEAAAAVDALLAEYKMARR